MWFYSLVDARLVEVFVQHFFSFEKWTNAVPALLDVPRIYSCSKSCSCSFAPASWSAMSRLAPPLAVEVDWYTLVTLGARLANPRGRSAVSRPWKEREACETRFGGGSAMPSCSSFSQKTSGKFCPGFVLSWRTFNMPC